ncbi:MAG: glycosyltransferase family 2 protein [Candidatus Curtissbacteria bacterium]|nr:glycosyltransferase family 2 protein [Candidatus Curtissbacteria bacterium]
MNIKLSVIVPVYNEEKRLKGGFEHYYSYLKKQKYPWELIFVNDGSRDNTLDLLNKTAKGKTNIRIISYGQNRGKGYAIVQGIKNANGEIVLFTDLDHSVPVETVENFFPYFEKGYSVVIGSRRVKGAKIAVHQKPLREFLGRGFTAIVNFFIYWGIADATCGFKAFENKIAQKIFSKITVFDWAFDAEILYICKKNKIKIAQAPVTWSDARGSKVSLKKDIVRSMSGIFKIRLNDLQGKYSL